jgi:hypothetical protein
MITDYIIASVMINNVPPSAYEQGFDDFLQDMDDPVLFSHFVNKYNVTEGIIIKTHENNSGYNVPCITAYVDYNTWNTWSEDMKEFWNMMFHPEIQKKEKNEWGIDCILPKLSDEEIDNIIIPLEKLKSRFPNV